MLKHLTDLAMDMKINKQYQKLARKCAEEIYTAMKIAHTDCINLTELSSTICVGEPKDYMSVSKVFLALNKSEVYLKGARGFEGFIQKEDIMPLKYFADRGANLSALHEEVMYETRHKSAWVEFMAKPQPYQQDYIETNIIRNRFFAPDDYDAWDSYMDAFGSERIIQSLIKGNVTDEDAYVAYIPAVRKFIGFGKWADVLDFFRTTIVEEILNQPE